MRRDVEGLGDSEGLTLTSHVQGITRAPSPALSQSDPSMSDSSLSSMSSLSSVSSLSIHQADVERHEIPHAGPSSVAVELPGSSLASSNAALTMHAPSASRDRSAKKFHQWQGSQKRRRLKRIKAAKSTSLNGPAASYRIKSSMIAAYGAPQTSTTSFDAANLPSARGAFVGIQQRVVRKKPFTLQELMDKGFELRKWDGRYMSLKSICKQSLTGER